MNFVKVLIPAYFPFTGVSSLTSESLFEKQENEKAITPRHFA